MPPFEPKIPLSDYADYGFKIQSIGNASIGNTVAMVGDLNDDGYDDFIVSGYAADGAYVLFGTSAGFANLVLQTMPAARGIKIASEVAGDQVAGSATDTYPVHAAAAAGDVNGDGIADLILGAYRNDEGGADAGAAYVLFGKTSGFGQVNLASLAAADGFKIVGDGPADWAGYSVSGAGDFNGDGYADIIVGAPNNDIGGTNSGAAYLIYGKAGGFGTIDLSVLPAATGFRIWGDLAYDVAGFSVSSAGDVNGDGFDDVVIGSPHNFSGASKAHVLFGRAEGYSAVDLTGLAATDGFSITSTTAGAGFDVSAAGDINGDGYGDVLVTQNLYQNGSAYVVFGKANGFGTINLATLTAAQGFRLTNFGISAERAGDVDGDGFDDIIVMLPSNGSVQSNPGQSFLYYGRSSGFGTIDPRTAGRADGVLFESVAGNTSSYSVAGGGDVDGDGYDDLLIAGSAAAYVILGRAYVPNVAPTGTDHTTSTWGDTLVTGFGFADSDGDAFADVTITTLPSAGTLYYDADGAGGSAAVAVTAGQVISAADLGAGKLAYRAGPGATSDSFTFQVRDSGGTKGGGADLDATPNAYTFEINATFDPDQPLPWLGENPASEYFDENTVRVPSGNQFAGDTRFVGDFNGDGRDEVYVFQVGTSLDFVQLGRADHYGDIVPQLPQAADRVTIVPPTGSGSIDAVAGGDINGDGFDELIIGFTRSGSAPSAVYVVFGSASAPSTIDLNAVTPGTGFRIDGRTNDQDSTGASLATADFNGDGFDDIVIGAPRDGANNQGAAYVIFGKASGFANLSLGSLAASDGFKIQGNTAATGPVSANAGSQVASAGDLNGDGFEDIFVYEPYNGHTTYLILGKASGFSTINLNTLALPNGRPISGFAWAAGDVNEDGYDDYFTRPGDSPGQGTIGTDAVLNYGGTQLATPVTVTLAGVGKATFAGDFNADGDIDAAFSGGVLFGNGTAFHATSATSPDWLGTSFGGIGTVGDYNGDGYDDLLSGGRIYFGRPSPVQPPMTAGGPGDDTLTGTPEADIFAGYAGNDTLDGLAGSDTALFFGAGAAYARTFYGNGQVRVSGPEGIDRLSSIEVLQFDDVTYATPAALFGPPASVSNLFGRSSANFGWSSADLYPRTTGDLNLDGRADLIGFGSTGVLVSYQESNGTYISAFIRSTYFTPQNGWTSQNLYPRLVGDVNGDGRADIVGFGDSGVQVSEGTVQSSWFQPYLVLSAFSVSAGGWESQERYPRRLGDVNGDGRDDIVAFGDGGVQVALSSGGSNFAAPFASMTAFGASTAAGGWSSDNRNPRELGDVNGDGMADIVGFGDAGVFVALATGGGHFATPVLAIHGFGNIGGWTSDDLNPRQVADINGDGAADVIGFGSQGVWVAISNRDGTFADPMLALGNFGSDPAAGGWTSDNLFPRVFGDTNGDGSADLVAFGDAGVQIALGTEWLVV